ncbi:metallophosphoesterase [Neobacillus cucumis]|uniref:metallophosphoesterase n=1 Tax=Neobacillus cucumis TaxID=1740721 RepID=UPI0019641232|nr:metallophosphoesterase [Neobacillus cucumis]MBM7651380.1 putative MPP superfamily phosphohydrolase [Neobacillus cucumis]
MIMVFLVIYIAINFYIGWNLHVYLSFAIPEIPSLMCWIFFCLISLSYFIGRLSVLRGPVGRLFKVIGSYYFAVFEFAIILLPIADVVCWILLQAGQQANHVISITGSAIVLLLVIFLLRGSWNAWSPVTRTYKIDIAKSAPPFSQIRIAIASDLHLGNLVGNRHLRKLVKRINDMKPDLILLPGDIIDDDIEPFLRNQMSQVMRELSAPHGIYAVLGNHEYYGGNIEEYVKQMSAIGIRVLRDEAVSIANVMYVVGRKDKTAEHSDPNGRLKVVSLLKDLDLSHTVVMMDHQPTQFDLAQAAGVDVLLSGHTHRGQFAPNHWITKRMFELDWGYMRKGSLHVIVSSGYGTWGPPIRIASRSEIIELTIHFQSPDVSNTLK